MKTLTMLLLAIALVSTTAQATLYRYKQVVDENTTHYAQQPANDATWYEHCTLDDGYTYVTSNAANIPAQAAIIQWEALTPPAQFYQIVKKASIHVDLMERRAARGLYMREDKHIVAGDPQKVSEWVATVKTMFGIGN